jgi:predicted nucleic acid-binding protein
MIVIADTSPINYLLLIDQIDLLPRLFQKIVIPEVVRDEMIAPGAPRSFFRNGLLTLLPGSRSKPFQ